MDENIWSHKPKQVLSAEHQIGRRVPYYLTIIRECMEVYVYMYKCERCARHSPVCSP